MQQWIRVAAPHARLVASLGLFLLADYALLRTLSAPPFSGTLLQPALVIAGAAFITLVWFSDAIRSMGAISVVCLTAFLGVQLLALDVARTLLAPFDDGRFVAFTLVSSAPVLLSGVIVHFADETLIQSGAKQLNRVLEGIGLAGLVILTDYVLLTYFDTLIWPHFWPTSAVIVLTVGFAILLWFPDVGRSVWMFRTVGLLLIFIGQSYWLHSLSVALEARSALGWLHLLGISGMLFVLILNYVNQMRPRNRAEPAPLPADLPTVAAVIPTYGEPIDVLERTVASVMKQDYPRDRLCVLVSDDSQREEVRAMAMRLGAHYLAGPQRDAKAGNLNAALAHIATICPEATLILTEDADDVLDPTFLRKTVGLFEDPTVAFVQTPKEVLAPRHDPFGTRDRMFYDVFQVGRNGYGAAFACGSGVIWRISAIEAVGGFSTWNVVEDLTTSYNLHAAGYRSEYFNERLSVGLAPEDIPGLLKQRGTWAVDTWRLFLFDNPMFKPGLTLPQRLQYLELGLFYVMSAFFMPILMALPIVSLLTGEFLPIDGSALFPWVAVNVLYYVALSRGRSLYMLRMWQYWIGLWPTYLKAFWIALRSRHKKPKYVVTRKTREAGFYGHLLWPQFLYLLLGTVAILHGLLWLPDHDPGTRLTNIGITLFFMAMVSAICRAAFYRTESLLPRPLARVLAVEGPPKQTG